jgi:hypothetical protein
MPWSALQALQSWPEGNRAAESIAITRSKYGMEPVKSPAAFRASPA